MSELTHEDVKKILQIIDEMDDREVHLEIGELKLHVTPRGVSATRLPTAPAEPVSPPSALKESLPGTPPPATPGAVFDAPPGHLAVRAPTMGTFYGAPSPGAAPFVQVGQRVAADETVCMFEVMKLFSSLAAGVAGTIAAILVENETEVDQNQVLMLIVPDA